MSNSEIFIPQQHINCDTINKSVLTEFGISILPAMRTKAGQVDLPLYRQIKKEVETKFINLEEEEVKKVVILILIKYGYIVRDRRTQKSQPQPAGLADEQTTTLQRIWELHKRLQTFQAFQTACQQLHELPHLENENALRFEKELALMALTLGISLLKRTLGKKHRQEIIEQLSNIVKILPLSDSHYVASNRGLEWASVYNGEISAEAEIARQLYKLLSLAVALSKDSELAPMLSGFNFLLEHPLYNTRAGLIHTIEVRPFNEAQKAWESYMDQFGQAQPQEAVSVAVKIASRCIPSEMAFIVSIYKSINSIDGAAGFQFLSQLAKTVGSSKISQFIILLKTRGALLADETNEELAAQLTTTPFYLGTSRGGAMATRKDYSKIS